MNFVFQHAFYCHIFHRSLRFISYKASMAKEKEYLRSLRYGASKESMNPYRVIRVNSSFPLMHHDPSDPDPHYPKGTHFYTSLVVPSHPGLSCPVPSRLVSSRVSLSCLVMSFITQKSSTNSKTEWFGIDSSWLRAIVNVLLLFVCSRLFRLLVCLFVCCLRLPPIADRNV